MPAAIVPALLETTRLAIQSGQKKAKRKVSKRSKTIGAQLRKDLTGQASNLRKELNKTLKDIISIGGRKARRTAKGLLE